MSEGVALCRLSMYDFAFDFLKLSLERAIWRSLEGRERSKQGILVEHDDSSTGMRAIPQWRNGEYFGNSLETQTDQNASSSLL